MVSDADSLLVHIFIIKRLLFFQINKYLGEVNVDVGCLNNCDFNPNNYRNN